MIIKSQSENPQFSWVIGKNPESIPLGKPLRKGSGLFWFLDNQTYILGFFECLRSTGSVSFGKSPEDEFAYLYSEEYCDPYLALLLLNTPFRDLINKDANEFDGDYYNELEIHSFRHSHFFDKIIRFFDLNYEIVDQSDHWSHYVVYKFYNKGKFKDLVVQVSLLMMFMALNENSSLNVEDALVERYIKIMNDCDFPYYPRSLFKLKACNGKKKLIEKLNTDRIKMLNGDTHQARMNFTNNNIAGNVVMDLGCGEFRHGRQIAKKVDKYIGVDIDEDVLEKAKKRAKKMSFENVEFYADYKDIVDKNIDTIICSEVIEHMEMEMAEFLLKDVIGIFHPLRIVITTPNKNFNINYLDKNMRHEDHKWEEDEKFVLDWLINIIDKVEFNYSIESFGVGDCVDGEYCTSGFVLKK